MYASESEVNRVFVIDSLLENWSNLRGQRKLILSIDTDHPGR